MIPFEPDHLQRSAAKNERARREKQWTEISRQDYKN